MEEEKVFEIIINKEEDKIEKLFKAVETKPIVIAIAPNCCEGSFVTNYQDKDRELGEAVKKGKVEFFYMQTCHVNHELVGAVPKYGTELKCYDALKDCKTVEELEGLLIGEAKDQLIDNLAREFRQDYLLELVPEDTKAKILKSAREKLDSPGFIEDQIQKADQSCGIEASGLQKSLANLVSYQFDIASGQIRNIEKVFAKYKQK